MVNNYFFKSKISNNILETPQGYLICKNVPIARVGYQEYLGSEIGIDTNKIIDVKRTANEVFNKKAIASFENLPFTDEHPEEEVNSENYDRYLKGIVSNVRRGEGEDRNKLIADITIYDPQIIEKVLNGKREISCGYTCLYETNQNGEYEQTKIRGNHIALVENGRAGELVAIRDSKNKKLEEKMKKNNKKQFNLFKLWIKDQEPEVLEEIKEEVEEILEEEGNEGEGLISSDEDLKEKMMEILTDSDMLETLAEKIAEIKQGDSDLEEIQEAEEMLEELESAVAEDEEMVDEETEDEEMVDEETEDEEEKTTSDALKFARNQLKHLAKIKDSKVRKQQVKLLMQDVNKLVKISRKPSKTNNYARINKVATDKKNDINQQLKQETANLKKSRRGIK